MAALSAPPRDRRSNSAPNIAALRNSEEDDDVLEPLLETPLTPQPIIDINALKNEILTDGMQAAADGDAEALQELVFKFGQVSVPHDSLINMYNTLGYTMLHYAVMYKRMDCIKTLIELGAGIERPTNVENKDTPLLLAIRYYNSIPLSCGEEEKKAVEKNKIEVVKFLISQGCQINCESKTHESAIIVATIMHNVDVVQELTKNPALNVNAKCPKGKTSLHIVAATNNHKIAQLLLHHGADVHLKDACGSTPLHIACYHGSYNVVELIFKERPQSQDTLLMQKDRAGNIPLMIAKKSPNSSAEIINFLISLNIDLQCTNELGDTLLHLFGPTDDAESTMIIAQRNPSLLSSRNIYRQTPLHCAALKGHKESLLVLIRNGADISVRDNDDMTPLMLAIKAGNIEIITVMLDLGCDIHSEAKRDKSLIVWAIENEYTALLKALIVRGDEVAKQPADDEENTFLHVAARSGSLRSIQVLMGSTVTEGLVHAENMYQQTALHVAAQHGKLQCVKELLDSSAAITKADKKGDNALHIACIHGQLHIVQFLLQRGLSAELSNGYLGTPLSCAAYHGHDHIVKYLFNRDVSCNGSYTELKVSPLLLATQKGHLKVVKVLLDHPRIDVTLTNEVGYNALAEAIVKGHSDIALEIINSDHWDKAMRMCNANNITPMRLLIEFMPDLARTVLDKCITRKEVDDNGTPCTTQMLYNYEFIDDFGKPVPGRLGNFLLRTVLHYKSENRKDDIPLQVVMVNHQADSWDQSTFLSTLPNTPVKSHSIVSVPQDWGPKVYEKDNHVITLMVKNERIELLKHPLVSELLSHKWNKIVMPSILLQLAFYSVFLGFLTKYILLLPNPRGDVCTRKNVTDDDDCLDFSVASSRSQSTATVLLVILSCVNLALEGLQAFNRKLKYFIEWQNYVEISLSSLTISFVLSVRLNDCFCASDSQWQLGSVVIFLAWIDLILLLKSIPFVAISINMLIRIINSFLKLVFLSILLIISFGIPLFLLLHHPEDDDAFSSIWLTLLKSVTMTIGELDFNDNFIEREVVFPFLYAFWILFVIVMPVLFNNLLVGLAVGDTGMQLLKANLTKLELQVNLVTELEERLPPLRLYFFKKFHMLSKPFSRVSQIMYFHDAKFDNKVKAVKHSEMIYSNVIQEYQKENPVEEIKEKLNDQENEIHLLKELLVKGYKEIENLSHSLQSERRFTDNRPPVSFAATYSNEREVPTNNDVINNAENQTGPELPLPVLNLF